MVGCPNPFAAISPSVLSIANLTIWAWSGSIASIPPGFVLCDGTNGTPDLRDKFIPGAGSSFAFNEVGGVSVHNHPFTSDSHAHATVLDDWIGLGGGRQSITNSNVDAGTSDNKNQRPPFFALVYIMKVV